MKLTIDPDAAEFGAVARRALEAAGGDLLVQRAEQDPTTRADIEPVLAELGAWDLDVRDSGELEAAAAVCRSAGWWATPYPVAERLCSTGPADALVVAGPRPSASTVGLELRWAAVDLEGALRSATPRPVSGSVRHSAFVTDVELGPVEGSGDVALALLLPCWTLLGMLDRALDVTRTQVQVREQFGQPLARFQNVQFQLTDVEVERAGVEVLAKYALWSVQTQRPEAVEDVLALRLAAVEAAETVFRITHQLHGATGFCDETQLSWLSRYSQPLRRYPLGPSATRAALTARLGDHGLVGLYSGAPT